MIDSARKNPKNKTSLRRENRRQFVAFACLPLVGADLRNIFGKETHRPVLSQPASGSSFNENML